MLAITPARIVQSETAADSCTDSDGLSTNMRQNETLPFTAGESAPVVVNNHEPR